MSKPLPEDFKEWTWDHLMTWACWSVMDGMVKGETLRTVMYKVLMTATQWKAPKGSDKR